jgi:hypothetical protein
MGDIRPKKIQLELEVYKGTPVRIRTPGGNSIGILDDISMEYLSLRPSLINEGVYSTDNKLIDEYVIQDKLPQKVKVSTIINIDPLTKGYMERIVKNLNDVSHPLRIIPPPTRR